MFESTDLYEVENKYTNGSWPRAEGTVVKNTPPNAIKVAYRKYTNRHRQTSQQEAVRLVFIHGTGMNKAIWHYHIDQMFTKFHQSGVYLECALAIDTANHAHSAKLNQQYLGDIFEWEDGVKDTLNVIDAENGPNSKKKYIAIGHSMGGAQAMYASWMRPQLFQLLIIINPVVYGGAPMELIRAVLVDPGRMETYFKVEPGQDPRTAAKKYFRTKSIFRSFKDQVLQPMVEDDLPAVTEGQTELTMLSTQHQTLGTYATARGCLKAMSPKWPEVNVPVVRLLSEFDNASPKERLALEKALGSKMTTVTFPGGKHNLHADAPEFTISAFIEAIERAVKKEKPSEEAKL